RHEKYPYYNLTVKVLRARNIKGTDLLSKADCYVELHLPTASPVIYRTRVIDNSSDPEWNETFQYRIHDAIKNTLELTLFDKDVLISDELTSVVFDITGIQAGHSLKNTFKLKEVRVFLMLGEPNGIPQFRCSFALFGNYGALQIFFLSSLLFGSFWVDLIFKEYKLEIITSSLCGVYLHFLLTLKLMLHNIFGKQMKYKCD
uniref:phospholipase A2 n=1 Tax=Naja naja TaxID=35670 RepID=A0A8C6YGF4_NAJNA